MLMMTKDFKKIYEIYTKAHFFIYLIVLTYESCCLNFDVRSCGLLNKKYGILFFIVCLSVRIIESD